MRNLVKEYGDIKALDHVSFKVEKGQIVGFLGANGAGKTTTMDILSGCIGADEGEALIAGFDITEKPIEAKQKLGYLPDVPPLYPEMRVEEAVEFAARINKVPAASLEQKVLRAMEKLDIVDVKHRLVGKLSKGYRQRVAFAQALVHDPEVLILDEPTEGLDPNQIVHIRELIRNLRGDHTIILSSHILSEVENVCDHIVIINKGKIVKQGTYADLVSELEAGAHYELKVAKQADQLKQSLDAMDGVASVSMLGEKDQTLSFYLNEQKADNLLDDITKDIVEKGYGLRSLQLKTRTLEDVFFQLTK